MGIHYIRLGSRLGGKVNAWGYYSLFCGLVGHSVSLLSECCGCAQVIWSTAMFRVQKLIDLLIFVTITTIGIKHQRFPITLRSIKVMADHC